MDTLKLDAAISELEKCAFPDVASEAISLANLLRALVSRLPKTPVQELSISEMLKQGESPNEPRSWTADELKRIGRALPFRPSVYVTKEGRRKEFHRLDCYMTKYGEAYDLDAALLEGAKPCERCGGVRPHVDPLQQAEQIDEMLQLVSEVHRFTLGDFSGLINLYEAATILDMDYDKLEKECRKEAKIQLKNVKEDRYFQIYQFVNILRYKDHPKDIVFSFKARRESCIRYSRKFGLLSSA